MRKWLLIIIALFAVGAVQGADLITSSITFTNFPTNGAMITVQGSTRTWTNNVTASPGTQVQQTNSIHWSATNLLNHLTAYPAAFGHFLSQSNATNVSIRGKVSEVMAVTTSGGYAIVTYSTQTVSSPTYVMRQPYTVEAPAVQTNLASWTAKHLTLSTSAVDSVRFTNVIGLHGAVNKLTGGWYTNSAIDKANLTNGVADLLRITNGVGINGEVFALTNGTYVAPMITNAVITNVAVLHGTLLGLTNGVLTANRITNAVGLNATVFGLTNGIWTNATLDVPKFTNAVNYGNAFSSQNTNGGGEQFGLLAIANGAGSSLAVGQGALASGEDATALAPLSVASGDRAIAAGKEAAVTAEDGSAFGTLSGVSKPKGTALGYTANVSHTNSTAVGAFSQTDAEDQVMLGSSTVAYVKAFGRLYAGSMTNNTLTGTNVNKGDWSDDETTSTSLANGNNVAVSSSGVYVRWAASGPTASFAVCGFVAGRNGQVIERWNDTGQTMTIANESGVDPTAANRILTTTGADVVMGTNTFVTFRYSAARSRWVLRSKSN